MSANLVVGLLCLASAIFTMLLAGNYWAAGSVALGALNIAFHLLREDRP